MKVKTAGRLARSLEIRSRALENLADGYLSNRRRSYWGGEHTGEDIDPEIAKRFNAMAEEQKLIQKALENATVVINLGDS